jgi:hypothetical protein
MCGTSIHVIRDSLPGWTEENYKKIRIAGLRAEI